MMEAQGLPSPLNAMIYTEADIDAAAKKVGFPAVIKPIAAAASMGVVRVDSLTVRGGGGRERGWYMW